MIDRLESRRLLAAPPVIDPIPTITVPAGKTYQLPVTGSGRGTLQYSVVQSNGVSAQVRPASNSWVEMQVRPGGPMRFMLFDDLTPRTVRQFRGLMLSGFFDGLDFHRVLAGQFAQGGDPTDTGTGGAQSRFDDEFHPDLLFTGVGQLAMANVPAGANELPKDQNSSQFFITRTPQPQSNFNFPLFGQLVRGLPALDAVLTTPIRGGTADRPVTPPVIESIALVRNTTDAVITLRAGQMEGGRSVTIGVRDSLGQTSTRTINVQVVRDTIDTPPILGQIADVRTPPGRAVTIDVPALDIENDEYEIAGLVLSGNEGIAQTTIDQANKRVIVQLRPQFSGAVRLVVGVKQEATVSRGGLTLRPGDPPSSLRVYDTQTVVIAVDDRPITAQPRTIYANVGVELRRAVLARFLDEDTRATASDSTAAIDWGDGSVTSNATIEPDPGGGFRVIGSHTYDRAATLPVTVLIASTRGVAARVSGNAVVNPIATLWRGRLSVNGTDQGDLIGVSSRDGQVRANVNGRIARFDAADVRSLFISGFAGNDTVTGGNGLPALDVTGGEGDDQLFGGPLNDTLRGDDGNDYAFGDAGNDLLDGGAGNDTLTGAAGFNTILGGDGDDRLSGGNNRDSVSGGWGNDRIYGNDSADTIDAGHGSDRVWAGGGDDLVYGGGSVDRIWGGGGNDTLFGGLNQIDYLWGGAGIDRLGEVDPADVALEFEP